MKLLLAIVVVLSSLSSLANDKGEFVKEIRVLSYNIFGKKEPSKSGCKERMLEIAKRFRTASPAYDIVSLNEHYNPTINGWWSCDGDILTNAIRKDWRYRDWFGLRRSRKHYPESGDLFRADGANSVFTKHHIEKTKDFIFVNSNDFPVNGFMLNRIKVSDDLTIDLWTTHLESHGPDNCSDKCRQEQYEHLLDYVKNYSGWYSVPYKRRPPKTVEVDGNAVIIMGDFNIGGPLSTYHRKKHKEDPWFYRYPGNGGYEKLMKYGALRDLWTEANPNSPGYTFDCSTNNLLLKKNCDSRMRIDYMFVPDHWLYQPRTYRIEVKNMKLVKWKTKSGMDTSDHYGLDATLKIYKKPEVRYLPLRVLRNK